jgi:hypothetical protein
MADRIIGKDAIKSTLIKGWKPSGMAWFKVLGDNLFLKDFEHSWDKAHVLEGRPWVFEGNLFSEVDFIGTIPPAKIVFTFASFWVRMFNLPLACMGENMGVRLGNLVGVVEAVDSNEDGVGWGEYLRVRIRLDISKSLAWGRVLKLNGDNIWVAFQHERLPKFCFQCGIIRHGGESCMSKRGGLLPAASAKLQYGPWLRASPAFKRSGFARVWPNKAAVHPSIINDFSAIPGSRAVEDGCVSSHPQTADDTGGSSSGVAFVPVDCASGGQAECVASKSAVLGGIFGDVPMQDSVCPLVSHRPPQAPSMGGAVFIQENKALLGDRQLPMSFWMLWKWQVWKRLLPIWRGGLSC